MRTIDPAGTVTPTGEDPTGERASLLCACHGQQGDRCVRFPTDELQSTRSILRSYALGRSRLGDPFAPWSGAQQARRQPLDLPGDRQAEHPLISWQLRAQRWRSSHAGIHDLPLAGDAQPQSALL
jgi:hypothetical protein